MSKVSFDDEVHKLKAVVKEELAKASMVLQGEFQQNLIMERQDRQLMFDGVRREVEKQREALVAAVEKVEKLSVQGANAGQSSMRQAVIEAAIEKLQLEQQSQQSTTALTFKEVAAVAATDNQVLSLKMSAAETTIAELQQAWKKHAGVLENLQQDTAKQAVVHHNMIQRQVEVGVHTDQIQQLRQENKAQHMQLMEHSSIFSSVSEEISALKSGLESLIGAIGAGQGDGAKAALDSSMHPELCSQFVCLEATLTKLRSDVAGLKAPEHLKQQAGMESIRTEVSKLKLGLAAGVRMNNNLEESLGKLRADVKQKFASLEQQSPIRIASLIADTLSSNLADTLSTRITDNLHKAECKDKLVQGAQPATLCAEKNIVHSLSSCIADTMSSHIADNLHKAEHLDKLLEPTKPCAEMKQEVVQESKEKDASSDLLAVGEWPAAEKIAMEEVNKPGSDASSSTQAPEPDLESVWIKPEVRNSLNDLVAKMMHKLDSDAADFARSRSPSPLRGPSPLSTLPQTTPSITPRRLSLREAFPQLPVPDTPYPSKVQSKRSSVERAQSSPQQCPPGPPRTSDATCLTPRDHASVRHVSPRGSHAVSPQNTPRTLLALEHPSPGVSIRVSPASPSVEYRQINVAKSLAAPPSVAPKVTSMQVSLERNVKSLSRGGHCSRSATNLAPVPDKWSV